MSLIHAGTTSTVVLKDGSVFDVAPVPMRIYASLETKAFPSFSEALQFFLSNRKVIEEKAIGNPEVQKLERQLSQQKESASKAKEEADRLTAAAESLYGAYGEVTALLAGLAAKGDKIDWGELKDFAKTMAPVESIDPQKKTVKVKVDGRSVQLEFTRSLEENATLLYARAKEAREKQGRSEELADATGKKIAELREKDARLALKERQTAKKSKEFWFEAYKWFVTSGGHLVLAGRDARTNDQLVKKHLTSQDRYAHADVHGAPSVVLKEGASASEAELREACIFALSHSKAWNAGIREGSAYWVLPDQVSKTPEAGEFVPRGAFIIRGKRNYEHHIQLELALGEVQYEGARKIMCGPRAAIEGRSDRYVVMAPGEKDRSGVSSFLARELSVPEEEVSRVMPPGEIEILQTHGLRNPE